MILGKKSLHINAKVMENMLIDWIMDEMMIKSGSTNSLPSESDTAQHRAAWALKAGIGRTSGPGEFQNLELAQKSLLRPKGVEAAETVRQ